MFNQHLYTKIQKNEDLAIVTIDIFVSKTR